jgi:hypothetical protein
MFMSLIQPMLRLVLSINTRVASQARLPPEIGPAGRARWRVIEQVRIEKLNN